MKSIKLILTSVLITLSFMLIGKVNAEELNNIYYNIDPVVVGDYLYVSGTSSDATTDVTKYYKGGTIETPGDQISSGIKVSKTDKYIIEVKFTPESGDTLTEHTKYYIGKTNNYTLGHFVSKDNGTGAVLVNFELKKSFKVSFNSKGGTYVEDQYVLEGTKLVKPTNPTKDSYTFYGWYEDIYDTWNDFNFNSEIKENMTLTALFVQNSKIINNVNVNLTIPKEGTKFKVEQKIDEHWQYSYKDQTPTLTVKSNTSNVIGGAYVVKNPNSYEFFEGTIESGKDYYFEVDISSMNNYYLAKTGLNVTVNGEKLSVKEIYPTDAIVIYKAKGEAKKANPMIVKAKNKTVKYKKVKKKKQIVSAITVKNNEGNVSFTKVSGKKNFTIDKKTGKIIVKKKTKKGTYKIKVKVTCLGNSNYNSISKTVALKIKVK